MSDTVDIQGKQVQLVHDRKYEFFSDEVPGYPKGLDIHPSSYYIYLPKDKLHPVTEVATKMAASASATAPEIVAPIQEPPLTEPILEETPSDQQDQIQAEEHTDG